MPSLLFICFCITFNIPHFEWCARDRQSGFRIIKMWFYNTNDCPSRFNCVHSIFGGDDDDNRRQHLGINININFKGNWLLSWGTRTDLTFSIKTTCAEERFTQYFVRVAIGIGRIGCDGAARCTLQIWISDRIENGWQLSMRWVCPIECTREKFNSRPVAGNIISSKHALSHSEVPTSPGRRNSKGFPTRFWSATHA